MPHPNDVREGRAVRWSFNPICNLGFYCDITLPELAKIF